jgi:hypothetical protein
VIIKPGIRISAAEFLHMRTQQGLTIDVARKETADFSDLASSSLSANEKDLKNRLREQTFFRVNIRFLALKDI